jgi:hypothetical protein
MNGAIELLQIQAYFSVGMVLSFLAPERVIIVSKLNEAELGHTLDGIGGAISL